MKVTKNDKTLSIEEISPLEAEVIMIAILNGAEARKSCEEPSRILRRLAMNLDKVIATDQPPSVPKLEPTTNLNESNLFVKRLNKVN